MRQCPGLPASRGRRPPQRIPGGTAAGPGSSGKASHSGNGTFCGLCRGRKCRFWFWKPSCGSPDSSCGLCRDTCCSASVGRTRTVRRRKTSGPAELSRNPPDPDRNSCCSAHDHSRCTRDTPARNHGNTDVRARLRHNRPTPLPYLHDGRVGNADRLHPVGEHLRRRNRDVPRGRAEPELSTVHWLSCGGHV